MTVELYWIPVGAGAHVVRWNARAFEAWAAARERRPRRDLYHCALVVTSSTGRYAVELAPAGRGPAEVRGVRAVGPVGLRWAGRLRLFRYEIRCRPDGQIPDLTFAVASPAVVSREAVVADRIVTLTGQVPTLVWGRDECRVGEMWNSNSVISWLLVRAGVDVASIPHPPRGRAPGWDAGVAVAYRWAFAVTARPPAPAPPRR